MARRLRHLIQTLDLQPATFAAREGVEVGELPRGPSDDDVIWQTTSRTRRQTAIGGYQGVLDTWAARASLPLVDGDAITDADFDVITNGPRTATAPTLRAEGVRAWIAIELHHVAPAGSDVLYRLLSGGVAYWWDGGAWAAATDPTLHWSTRAHVQANVASLSPAARDLAVQAWLQSDDGAAPSFYGFTIAYAVRPLGDEDDALIRTLRRWLLDELREVAIIRHRTAGGSGAGPIPLATESTYVFTGTSAVFNLTADPDELSELPGTFAPGVDGKPGTPATWAADAPIADGQLLQLEMIYAPEIIVSRHRDLVQVHREPAILIMPGGGLPTRIRGSQIEIVRNLEIDPPEAVGMQAPARISQPIEVSVIAELGADVRRIETALRAWFGGSGYRAGVSPETGRGVDVREITPFRTTTALLSQGVQEARAAWTLTYDLAGADQVAPINLVRSGGTLADVDGG